MANGRGRGWSDAGAGAADRRPIDRKGEDDGDGGESRIVNRHRRRRCELAAVALVYHKRENLSCIECYVPKISLLR